MHKSATYGKILLKQKYKQIASKEDSKGYAFASQLVKHLPYTQQEIFSAIQDLIREDVCYFDGDYLCQKRMIKDNDISIKRSKAGRKGGEASSFASAKSEANTENESANEDIVSIKKEFALQAVEINERRPEPLDNHLMHDEGEGFIPYWCEHGINDKKVRYQKEKSFDVHRRLTTWKSRDKRFTASKGGFRDKPDMAWYNSCNDVALTQKARAHWRNTGWVAVKNKKGDTTGWAKS